MSSLIMFQHILRNSLLKPSGPGALFEGSFMTSLSMSSFVKGVSMMNDLSAAPSLCDILSVILFSDMFLFSVFLVPIIYLTQASHGISELISHPQPV
jgi:hypothetical protein